MNDKQLRSKLIRLAHARPELRAELLPLLTKQAVALMTPEATAKAKSLLALLKKMGWPVYGWTPTELLYHRDIGLGSSRKDWTLLQVEVSHWDPAGLIEMYGSESDPTVQRRFQQIAAKYGKPYTTVEDLRATVLEAEENELNMREAQAKKIASMFPQGTTKITVMHTPLNPDSKTYAILDLEIKVSAFFQAKLAAADKKVKGKALDKLISQTYYKHGTNVMIDMMSIPKIYKEAETAYNNAASHEEGMKALDVAMKASVAKYKV